MFQSTHPRGVRRYDVANEFYFGSFNPRTHEGCDRLTHHHIELEEVSIHAPTRGATFAYN